MAEIKENVVVPAVPEKAVEKVVACTCDLCGRRGIPDEEHLFDGINWSPPTTKYTKPFDLTVVARRYGSAADDYGAYVQEEYHVCSDCWAAKVVPLFAGKSPTVTKCDW